MCTRTLRAAAALLLLGACVASKPSLAMGHETRDAFLHAMDQALATRDAAAILTLSDLDDWRRSGRPQPVASTMTLPAAPLTRVRDLSPSEALYKDGNGRQWKLRFKHDEERDTWLAVLLDNACPRGGMARGPQWDNRPRANAPAVWTPLECWPLPL